MKAVLNNYSMKRAVERGVGLIEVLVALVIFALGVVGMAGLQLRTMSSTMDLTQRSYVIAKTQDIADRIRSNGIPAKQYLNTYNANGNFCDAGVPSGCADSVSADAIACAPVEMVAFDLFDAFCADENNPHASDGSYEKQVLEWQVDIACEFPLAGVMTPTTECNELGARVVIETSWFARSVDDDLTAAPQRDSMTLRFVP